MGAILAYLGTKVSNRSQITSKKIETSAPQWQAFVEKMENQQEEYVKKIKEINNFNIKKLEERINSLEHEYDDINKKMHSLMDKYDQAIEVLRKIYEQDKKFFEKIDIPIDLWLEIKKNKK